MTTEKAMRIFVPIALSLVATVIAVVLTRFISTRGLHTDAFLGDEAPDAETVA
jgi:hypothetical protein